MAGKRSQQLITYEPNPSAIPFHDSLAQVKALEGPVGSGKSLAAIMEFFLLCFEADRPVRGLVLRQSWPELRDSTKVTWLEWLPEPKPSEWRQTDRQMVLRITGRDGVERAHTMDFRHARTAQEATRFLSTEYGFIWLEECAPAFDVGRGVVGAGIPKEIFEVALMRQRQQGLHRLHLICTFNPPSKRHWCHQVFKAPAEKALGPAALEALRIDRKGVAYLDEKKGFAFFSQPPFENQRNLPFKYYEKLLDQLSPDLADRFVHGKSVTVFPGMPVYSGVILEDFHVVERVELLGGIGVCTCHDFGRTPATLIYQVTPEGQMRFLREIQLWGASTEKMAEVLERTLRTDFPENPWIRGYGDPAGQNPTETDDKTSFMIMAAKGFPLSPGAETPAARIEAMKQRAARSVGREPALLIDSNGCPMFSEALLGGYRYPKASDGQIGFSPLKNDYSHSANAGEYGVSGEFSVYDGKRHNEDDRAGPKRNIPRYNPLEESRERGGGGWMSG